MLRGSSRRDIHVPSLLARHPCLAPPCATPTLGLLKGSGPTCLKVCKKPKSHACFFAGKRTIRRHRKPLSGGRMESARRGASGMDAARGVKGRGRRRHGWPLYAGPRSVDGMREVERSEPGTPSPDVGARPFGSFGRGRPSGNCQKGLAQQGETKRTGHSIIAYEQVVQVGDSAIQILFHPWASPPPTDQHAPAPPPAGTWRESPPRPDHTRHGP